MALLALAIAVVAAVRLQRGQTPGFGLQDFLGIGLGGYQHIAALTGVTSVNLPEELSAQLSWPATLLALIGAAAALPLKDWRYRWLVVMGAGPMLAIGLLAHFWYSRYLLFTLPPLIIGAVAGGEVSREPCAAVAAAGRIVRPGRVRGIHGTPIRAADLGSRGGPLVGGGQVWLYRRLGFRVWLP